MKLLIMCSVLNFRRLCDKMDIQRNLFRFKLSYRMKTGHQTTGKTRERSDHERRCAVRRRISVVG